MGSQFKSLQLESIGAGIDFQKWLKLKQAKRKEIRAEQETKINQQKKEEEEKLKKEEAERKAQEAEDLKKAQEEAEAKKKDSAKQANGPQQSGGPSGGVAKTKEQLEEEMKNALAMKIKPLNIEEMDSDEMRTKAEELFNIIIQLETEKYDFEDKKVSQAQEMNELREKQKARLRAKAVKKGMDPEAFSEKHPPLIRM